MSTMDSARVIEALLDQVDALKAVALARSKPAAIIYALNVTVCIKPERREEFLVCIRANQHGTLTTEPLALLYDWGESVSEPNTFHFHEQYQGKAGFDAHAASPHFAAWEKFAGSEPFTCEPAVVFYEIAQPSS
jgi:quinol monooxygenase YgiN